MGPTPDEPTVANPTRAAVIDPDAKAASHESTVAPTKGDREPSLRPIVAGYELLRVIGRGGMGVVWEAIDQRLERHVAIKVHRGDLPGELLTHLWSEARMAAKVADPSVVGVHDIGTTLDGRPYYTMDFVAGTDLNALLREGPLPQARVLALGAQIASAVAAAHERGIAHRDLKPGNILVDEHGRARVLDFGLAHGARGKDVFENAVFGTPSYMSPEQVRAEPVGPAADIHALGIILYEMLTGVRPYVGDGAEKVMHAIVNESPMPLTARNASIHLDVERLVLRCLEKAPEARFSPARKLAASLVALMEGRPLDVATPTQAPTRRSTMPAPVMPGTYVRERAPMHHTWQWKLRSTPAQLWPFVSNTERVNRAIGMTEVEFTDAPDGEGASVRSGRTRVFGMEMTWRELPFEWALHREHSVHREYTRGPLEALWNRVQLATNDAGGTDLKHEIWLVPRNVLGRVAASWEMTQKIGKNLDELYRRIDGAIEAGGGSPLNDPFEPPFEPTFEQQSTADAACRGLLRNGFDARLVKRLASYVLGQPSKVLERMRPYMIADAWGVDRRELLTLLLHAANGGLLDLAWDLVCPRCLAAHESCSTLAGVERMGACAACNRAYERDLRESVELVFRPHPGLRDAEHSTYCAGAPALRPHVLVQQRLDAGEERVLEVELPAGEYRLVASRIFRPFTFTVSGAAFGNRLAVSIEGDVVDARPSVIRPGLTELTLLNATADDQLVRIEVPEGRTDRVTAADALTLPDFCDLFSDEMLADGEHMTVSRMAFLFVELVDRAGLLARSGDGGAWALLRKLDELFETQLRAHHGTNVPGSLDAHVAAFNTSASAVSSAIALSRAAAALGEPIRAAVHDGRCIALTRGGRTEYFGKTLHRGNALVAEALPGGVALSAAVAGERAVAELLQDAGVKQDVVVSGLGAYRGMRVVLLDPNVKVGGEAEPAAG